MFGKAKKNDPASKRFKLDMAARLDGKSIKCVTERINGIEEVVGKSGAIIVKGDELLIYSEQNVIFRCNVLEMTAGELMSLDGVIITAPDKEHGGEVRSVIAYYSYWRDMK